MFDANVCMFHVFYYTFSEGTEYQIRDEKASKTAVYDHGS